jgi:Fe-S cluster assembly iron-binding protein IscA
MSDIFFFMSIITIITSLIALFIRKKYAIDTYFPYRPFNNTQKWVNRILLSLTVLSAVGIFVFSYPEILVLICIGFGIIINGYSTYMEYKHEREEKEYIVSFVWTIGTLVMFFSFMFLTLQTKTVEDVIHDSFNPDAIEQLEIWNNAWIKEEIIYKREKVMKDKQMIELLFSELSKVKVRNSIANEGNQDNFYKLYLMDDNIFSIGVYDKYITIDSEAFRVIGENDIYIMLEGSNIDWVYPE